MDDLKLASERIEEILQHEKPLRRKEGYVYSIAAKNFFSKIRALRNRGFSFIQICWAFEKTELLPEESSPYSFRQAFLRESARRDKANELLRELKDGVADEEQEKKLAPVKTQLPGRDNPAGGAKKEEANELKQADSWASKMQSVRERMADSSSRFEVKPDNTFEIKPIDPNLLP